MHSSTKDEDSLLTPTYETTASDILIYGNFNKSSNTVIDINPSAVSSSISGGPGIPCRKKVQVCYVISKLSITVILLIAGGTAILLLRDAGDKIDTPYEPVAIPTSQPNLPVGSIFDSSSNSLNQSNSSTTKSPSSSSCNLDEECQYQKEIASNILKVMNLTIDPCNDFYEYACGNWMKVNPRPSRYSGSDELVWNNFVRLVENIEDIQHKILIKTNEKDDLRVTVAKRMYQDCIGDPEGPIVFLDSFNRGNRSSANLSGINMEIPYDERPKVNFTDLESKLFKKLQVSSTADKSSKKSVRSDCMSLVEAFKGKRLVERVYLKNIPLNDDKIKEAVIMMSNIHSAFNKLLGSSQIPWTKDKDDSWQLEASKIQDSLKKVQYCIGYYRELLDDDQLPVILSDQKHFKTIHSIDSSTDDNILTPTCFWESSPFVPEAHYDILGRSIEVTYSLIQPPFFDTHRPTAMNYGAMGVLMGHELAHAVDISKYQKSRELGPPLACIINQYSKFIELIRKHNVLHNLTILGEPPSFHKTDTFVEDFADNIGIRAAFTAFKELSISPSSTFKTFTLPGLEGFTNEQLFFLGFSQQWCSEASSDAADFQIQADPHSPERFRVLGSLQNSREFSSAWKCPKGSRLNPIEKCILL